MRPIPSTASLRTALVTNIPAPYRVPVLGLLDQTPGIALKVFFCSGREPDRAWNLPELGFTHVFLRERFVTWRARFIHVNPDLWRQLADFAPEVVVTTGFNPTHLLAWWFAVRRGAAHVAMTDGTAASESRLSTLHRLVRRLVYRRTEAFVGASDGSVALYREQGVDARAIFRSQLCTDNDAFAPAVAAAGERDVDLVFCGRFVAGKLPLFAIEVAVAVAALIGRTVRLLMIGAGPLEADTRATASRAGPALACEFAGFATQEDLPRHYARGRLMLFPTAGDTWGVVANEACAAGLPVIVSPQAGVAGELVRDGENGRVLPLNASAWATAAATILGDEAMWRRMSERSRTLVAGYTFAGAASGLAAAVAHAAAASARR